jgi:hypothetical protein
LIVALPASRIGCVSKESEMAPDRRAADSTPAAEHAALRAQYDALQDRLARETCAHDSERKSHAATAAQLALLRAAHPAPPGTAIRNSAGWRIDRWLRQILSRHQSLLARLHRFTLRHPRLRRLSGLAARLAWWTVTLQLPHRIARRWQQRRAAAAPRFALRAVFAATSDPSPQPGRRLVCLTHVLPHPPRAGNEYRIARMLPWLSRHGWEVLLVVCPPPHLQLTEEHVRQAVAAFPNLIVCRRDGTLLHHLSDDGAMLKKLAGRRPRDFAAALGERLAGNEASGRTPDLRGFCPDLMVELVLHIEKHLDPEVLLAEYVFMTRPFPLLGPRLRKVIDTIDVFSNKPRKVEQFGIADPFSMTGNEEAFLLNRADLLIAIQPEEAADLRRLAPALPVVSVGVDFDTAGPLPAPATAPVILMIGSDNQINHKGLADFVRFAWPLVRRAVPDAQLRVVGAVGDDAEISSPGISILGRIDDIGAAYAQARVVINPAVAGTGLKIKTVEALCHFRPIVVWPSGIEGIDPQARHMCHVANDWFEFAQHVIGLAQNHDGAYDFAPQRQEMTRHFAPDCVYAPLAAALQTPWSRGP